MLVQMYLNGGVFKTSVLSPTTVDLIMSNQTNDLFGEGNTYYGLAFGVVTDKGFNIGEEVALVHLIGVVILILNIMRIQI